MKIDLEKFLTIEQLMTKIGCSRRAVFRVMRKAKDDGKTNYFVEVLGRTLVPVDKVDDLSNYYQPFGSERRSAAAKEYGRLGGTQKRINREKAARAAKRGAAR